MEYPPFLIGNTSSIRGPHFPGIRYVRWSQLCTFKKRTAFVGGVNWGEWHPCPDAQPFHLGCLKNGLDTGIKTNIKTGHPKWCRIFFHQQLETAKKTRLHTTLAFKKSVLIPRTYISSHPEHQSPNQRNGIVVEFRAPRPKCRSRKSSPKQRGRHLMRPSPWELGPWVVGWWFSTMPNWIGKGT